MSDFETSSAAETAAAVTRRGALPVAPLAMPEQRLERVRRPGPLMLFALSLWGRPLRIGR